MYLFLPYMGVFVSLVRWLRVPCDTKCLLCAVRGGVPYTGLCFQSIGVCFQSINQRGVAMKDIVFIYEIRVKGLIKRSVIE